MFSVDLYKYIKGDFPQEYMNLRYLSNLNLAGNHLAGSCLTGWELESLEFFIIPEMITVRVCRIYNFEQLEPPINDSSRRIPAADHSRPSMIP